MLILFLMVAGVLVSVMLAFWLLPDDARRDTVGSASSRPANAPVSLEGVLVAQLRRGEINRHQYRNEMTLLAARENERHPMAVPPEPGTAAA
jgi:hypothetical protein